MAVSDKSDNRAVTLSGAWIIGGCLAFLPLAAPAQTLAAQEQEAVIASATVAIVGRAEMVGRVPISGTLVPNEEVLVFPQVNGFIIDSLAVDIGDQVAAGQVLATLNTQTLAAQLAQAEAERQRARAAVSQAQSQIMSADANATQARSVLERTQSLRAAGTATQAVLDQAVAAAQTADATATSARDGLLVAQAQLQQAQAQLDIANLNLEHATLRAPTAGIISARNGQIGAIAASGGEPIFRIIRDGVIEVEAEVIETVLGEISVNDAATLEIASIGQVGGVVRRISPIVDPVNRLGDIRIDLSDTTGLRSGLFASGWIITEQRQSLAVPTTAVLTEAAGSYVLVVKDGVLEKRSVVPGLIWNDQREILGGLAEGDMIVAKAGAFFGDGDQINPIFPDADIVAQGASQ